MSGRARAHRHDARDAALCGAVDVYADVARGLEHPVASPSGEIRRAHRPASHYPDHRRSVGPPRDGQLRLQTSATSGGHPTAPPVYA
jgi:hypothetical protein